MNRINGFLAAALAIFTSCGPDQGIEEGTYVVFSPEVEWKGRRTFFDFPYPSDFRKNADGLVDLLGFPNSAKAPMAPFPAAASGQNGFSVVPIGYFRFTAPLSSISEGQEFEPSVDSPLMLVELADAPRLLPVAAALPRTDVFVPENLLAVGVAPGVVLLPKTTYAFIVRRDFNDSEGKKLGSHPLLAALLRGEKPAGSQGEQLKQLYAPLLKGLKSLKVPFEDVAAATVFTTSDVVEEVATLSSKVKEAFSVQIENLALSARADASFCHITGTLKVPQFQKGTPPFATEGLFEFGADGLPVKQRDELAFVSMTLPKTQMPPGGYPLVVYFHGSGGVASEFVDGGNEENANLSMWPAAVLTPKGFAMAGASLPLSPERVAGVGAFDYLNLENPVALRDTFRQGIIESRLFIDALEALRIPSSVVASCAGPALPSGETAFRFSLERLSVQGQSMGGMYANMVSAVEPRIQALVPTGAGGFWTHFAMVTPRIPEPKLLLGSILGTGEDLSYLHPAFHLIQTTWQAADPIIYLPRLARRPLAGHPVRSIYEPIGDADSYFSRPTFDAMVASYGHPLAGNVVWDTTFKRVEQLGFNPTVAYPVTENLVSDDGRPFTGVAAQYALPEGFDGHGIYRRSPAVMHQYACFHSTFRKTGKAVVVAPEADCPD